MVACGVPLEPTNKKVPMADKIGGHQLAGGFSQEFRRASLPRRVSSIGLGVILGKPEKRRVGDGFSKLIGFQGDRQGRFKCGKARSTMF